MDEKIKKLLLKVSNPARYCGGEFNTPVLDENAALRFLMCFPDVYEVAHSNLGIKILYGLINRIPDCACEMCYAPWQDMAQLLREESVELFSLETRKPMREFGMVGFSLQYELSYSNVLLMLDLGGIPLKSKDRAESDPIIIGGGPCTVNPAPVEEFFDLFCIGDGEETTAKLCGLYLKNRENGGTKRDFLESAAKIGGVYVPSVTKENVSRALITDLDSAFFPTDVQVSNIEAVHNRAVLEIFRGCTRGCRFCQAGMIYRPVRERSPKTLVKYAKELIDNCGYDEISFSSLSTCDYPYLRELLTKVKPYTEKAKVNISLPSTRVDSFEAEFVETTRKSSITFAPEAGTQRLRDVINKNVTENDILSSCRSAFEKGYTSIKLYFMIGLPTETYEDLDGIVDLAKKIRYVYKTHSSVKKSLALSVSASTFVPKPFTPFQWEAQIGLEEITKKQYYLKDRLKTMGIKFGWHDGKTSRLEVCMARGDNRLNDVILSAFQNGCTFDGWTEKFEYDKWTAAFDACGVQMDEFAGAFDTAAELAWDFVNTGVSKKFLLTERERAYNSCTTPDCRGGCENCGITALTKRACYDNM